VRKKKRFRWIEGAYSLFIMEKR